MKLTEAKLKQMILETMQRSKNYEKLKSLMVTKEGVFEAESRYEMVRDSFEDVEQMHMDILFAPLGLAREREELRQKSIEAYDAYNATKEWALFHPYDLAQRAFNAKNKEWIPSLEKLNSHIKKYSSELSYELSAAIVDACLVITTVNDLGDHSKVHSLKGEEPLSLAAWSKIAKADGLFEL